MNIWYMCSDNYVRHLGVSMLSLMKNNRDIDRIRFFVQCGDISAENRQRLYDICLQYGRELIFTDSSKLGSLCDDLGLQAFRGSYVVYGKAFPEVFLPDDVDKILFIDAGDTVVSGSLKELEALDMDGYVLAAVPATDMHAAADGGYADGLYDVSLAKKQMYFNCGVLWMNIEEWKKRGIGGIIREGLKNDPHFSLADQTLMNQFIPPEAVKVLDLKYNYNGFALSPKIADKRLTAGGFYTLEDVRRAKNSPVIIHWPGRLAHPYVKGALCRKKQEYMKYREMSPWKDEPLTEKMTNLLPKAENCSPKALLAKYKPVLEYYFPRG